MRFRFAVLATLFCALPAAAGKSTVILSVQVNTVDGKPVEHADVEVKLMKGEKAHTMWRLRTHEEGLVKGPDEIPQGTYVVQATCEGFAPFSQTFEVHDERKTIEIQMTSALTQINVHVTSQGGKPIDHADVVVKFVKGHSLLLLGKAIRTSWEMRTNQEGIAKVPEIPQGLILIQVIATGYQTFGQTFDVTEIQKTVDVKLNSPQEQYTAH